MYVTKPKHPSADDYYEDIHHAEASLRAAQAAVEAAGKPVKVETAILDGPPGPALVEESRDADIICVGSVGIGRYARSILGSTATDLAEKAHCPVAIIRPQEEQPRHAINWVVVEVNEQPDNEAVVEVAIQEAKLRQAPVLASATAMASKARWIRGSGAIPTCTSTQSPTKPTSFTSSRSMTNDCSSPSSVAHRPVSSRRSSGPTAIPSFITPSPRC